MGGITAGRRDRLSTRRFESGEACSQDRSNILSLLDCGIRWRAGNREWVVARTAVIDRSPVDLLPYLDRMSWNGEHASVNRLVVSLALAVSVAMGGVSCSSDDSPVLYDEDNKSEELKGAELQAAFDAALKYQARTKDWEFVRDRVTDSTAACVIVGMGKRVWVNVLFDEREGLTSSFEAAVDVYDMNPADSSKTWVGSGRAWVPEVPFNATAMDEVNVTVMAVERPYLEDLTCELSEVTQAPPY